MNRSRLLLLIVRLVTHGIVIDVDVTDEWRVRHARRDVADCSRNTAGCIHVVRYTARVVGADTSTAKHSEDPSVDRWCRIWMTKGLQSSRLWSSVSRLLNFTVFSFFFSSQCVVGLLIINTVINYGPPAWWTFSFSLWLLWMFWFVANKLMMINLLKITDIGRIQTLILMYKYHHGVLPTAFVNYYCKVADVHSYLTRQSTSLHISYARTNQRKNTIKITGPKLWNKQSLFIRDSPSLKIFKSRIQTEIVNSYLSQYHS